MEEKGNRSRRTIVTGLVSRLAEEIRSRSLRPGAHMASQQLADRLGVSRSPINEALKVLAKEGLVAHRANRGYFVVDPPPSAELPRIEKKDPFTEIYFRIAEERLDGLLPDNVSKSFLQARYGLTQGQLNELLTRIVREGWIEQRPGYGLAFSPILTTPDTLLQSYRVRMALEPASLLEPGYALDPREAAECRRIEQSMLEGALETMSADALYDRGVRFHECIVGASRNPFYLDALSRINSVRRLLAYRSMGSRSRYYEQARDHLAILDLLEQGRNEEASWMLKFHLGKVIHNLTRIRPLLEPREASRSMDAARP